MSIIGGRLSAMQEPLGPTWQALASAVLFSPRVDDLILAVLVALAFMACGVKTLLGAGLSRRHWRTHRF